MAARHRTPHSLALTPDCRSLETRLAPSGNFLSHGFAEASRAIKHIEQHHHAEHATTHAEALGQGLAVHYHHIVMTNGAAK